MGCCLMTDSSILHAIIDNFSNWKFDLSVINVILHYITTNSVKLLLNECDKMCERVFVWTIY